MCQCFNVIFRNKLIGENQDEKLDNYLKSGLNILAGFYPLLILSDVSEIYTEGDENYESIALLSVSLLSKIVLFLAFLYGKCMSRNTLRYVIHTSPFIMLLPMFTKLSIPYDFSEIYDYEPIKNIIQIMSTVIAFDLAIMKTKKTLLKMSIPDYRMKHFFILFSINVCIIRLVPLYITGQLSFYLKNVSEKFIVGLTPFLMVLLSINPFISEISNNNIIPYTINLLGFIIIVHNLYIFFSIAPDYMYDEFLTQIGILIGKTIISMISTGLISKLSLVLFMFEGCRENPIYESYEFDDDVNLIHTENEFIDSKI